MYIYIYLIYIPKTGIAWSYNNSIFNSIRNCHAVFYRAVSFYISTNSAQLVQFLHILTNTYFLSFNSGHPNESEMYLIVVLIFISLIISDVETLFICLLTICISCLEKCLFKSFGYFYH